MNKQEFEEQVRKLYPEGGHWVHLDAKNPSPEYEYPYWGFVLDITHPDKTCTAILVSHSKDSRPDRPWSFNTRFPDGRKSCGVGASLDEARANSLLSRLGIFG